jgi:hypothetical protein
MAERMSEAVTAASSCMSEENIRKWFDEVQEYVRENNLEEVTVEPPRIFNGEETGFQICPSTGRVLLAEKGAKNVYSFDEGSSKENITVMFSFSANGKKCPMIVYPYKRIPENIAQSFSAEWGIA